jgi:hypothetical protein
MTVVTTKFSKKSTRNFMRNFTLKFGQILTTQKKINGAEFQISNDAELTHIPWPLPSTTS